MSVPIQTPHDLVRAYQSRAKKRFGQHFLSDPSILDRIADAGEVEEGDHVLEIGPGPGALTWVMLERGAHVTSVEIDRDAQAHLTAQLGHHERFSLVSADATRLDLVELMGEVESFKVVANLPYNVGTDIYLSLTQSGAPISLMALMFQREVAERMVATQGDSSFGSLALFTRLHHDAEIALVLPPGAFSPPPKVHSALATFRPVVGTRIPELERRERFERIVRATFQMRRKTMPNGLKKLGVEKTDAAAALEEIGVGAKARPEELTFEDFDALSKLLPQA